MVMIRLLEMMIAALYVLDRGVEAASRVMRRTRAAALSCCRRILPLQAGEAIPLTEGHCRRLGGLEAAERRPSVPA